MNFIEFKILSQARVSRGRRKTEEYRRLRRGWSQGLLRSIPVMKINTLQTSTHRPGDVADGPLAELLRRQLAIDKNLEIFRIDRDLGTGIIVQHMALGERARALDGSDHLGKAELICNIGIDRSLANEAHAKCFFSLAISTPLWTHEERFTGH